MIKLPISPAQTLRTATRPIRHRLILLSRLRLKPKQAIRSKLTARYNAYRVITVIVNTLLLASIVLTAVCGIAMSAHAVPFLYGVLPVSFARRFHLAMSF